MNNGAFGENFPYSNFHDLNMDWIIKIAKDFLDQYTHIQQIISDGETEISNQTTEALSQLETKAEQLNTLLQTWYDTHSEDIANQLADAIESFRTESQAYVQQIIESIPQDYSSLSLKVTDVNNILKSVIEAFGVNIYNFSTNKDNTFLDTTTGAEVESTSYISSAKIPVTAGNILYLRAYDTHDGTFRCYFYRADNSYIERVTANASLSTYSTITVPANSAYMRISMAKTEFNPITLMVSNQVITNYIPYYTAIDRQARKAIPIMPTLPNGFNFNNLTGNFIRTFISDYSYTNAPFPAGILIQMEMDYGIVYQIAIRHQTGQMAYRFKSDTWSNYIYTPEKPIGLEAIIPNNTDFNNLTGNFFRSFISDYTYTNNPFNAGILLQLQPLPTLKYQIAYFHRNGTVAYRFALDDNWSAYFFTYPENRIESSGVCFGDSLMMGAIHPESGQDFTASDTYKLSERIRKATGLTTMTNKGSSGSGFVYTGNNPKTIGDVIRETNITGYDLIVVSGGRNDSNSTLGTQNSVANDGTICGAVKAIINYIKTANANAQIIWIQTTPNTSFGDVFTGTTPGGWSLNNMETEIGKICENENIPYITWKEYATIKNWNGAFVYNNNAHPKSEEVYKKLGSYLGGQIAKYFTAN